MNYKIESSYRGSAKTYQMVRDEIAKRWGEDEAKKYDPASNCFTFRKWSENHYRIKKSEKSIRSLTFVEKKDSEGNIIEKYPRTVHLFYHLQVEPVNS